jgi:hypothetical protein
VDLSLSRPSHRLGRRNQTRVSVLDTPWTLTCGGGLRRTGWTPGTDLRIRRLEGDLISREFPTAQIPGMGRPNSSSGGPSSIISCSLLSRPSPSTA